MNLTVPGTYTFYDDDGDDVNWSLSGDDSNHFTITEDASGNGVLTFKNPSPGTNLKPADFENPVDTGSNNDYAVTVEANDGQGESNSVGTFTVTVNVTPVDETPVITSNNATQTFAEIEYDVLRTSPEDYWEWPPLPLAMKKTGPTTSPGRWAARTWVTSRFRRVPSMERVNSSSGTRPTSRRRLDARPQRVQRPATTCTRSS